MVSSTHQPRHIRAVTRLLWCGAVGGFMFSAAGVSGRTQSPAAPRPAVVSPATPPAVSAVPSSNSDSVPSLSDMRIETFGPERGYVVGVETVVLLCVVRNTGAMPLPADALRLRCYPISGLDYTSGNLLPTLPLLAPGQAVAYRWRLAQSDAKMVLAAGVVLERTEEEKRRRGEEEKASTGTQGGGKNALTDNSATTPASLSGGTTAASDTPSPLPLFSSSPLLAFSVIPRLPRAPGFGDAPVFKDALPHADERDGVGLALNNRVGMRVQIGTGRDSLLQLAARDGAGWRMAAFALPLLRVNVAEDGQNPWWQTFRCQTMRAREDKDSAALTLTGTLGAACRVEIVFEARPDTCVIAGRARLTATRPLRLSGIHLPALIAGSDDRNMNAPRQDGSPVLLADTPSPLPDDARVAAAHSGAATFGLSWPADPPLPNWKWTRLSGGDGAYTLNLGAQAGGSVDGDLVPAGTTIEIPFRLFAFAPSDTVRDALRFQLP